MYSCLSRFIHWIQYFIGTGTVMVYVIFIIIIYRCIDLIYLIDSYMSILSIRHCSQHISLFLFPVLYYIDLITYTYKKYVRHTMILLLLVMSEFEFLFYIDQKDVEIFLGIYCYIISFHAIHQLKRQYICY